MTINVTLFKLCLKLKIFSTHPQEAKDLDPRPRRFKQKLTHASSTARMNNNPRRFLQFLRENMKKTRCFYSFISGIWHCPQCYKVIK